MNIFLLIAIQKITIVNKGMLPEVRQKCYIRGEKHIRFHKCPFE